MRLALAVVLALVSGAVAGPAHAHAIVLESRPAVDAVLTGPELEIELQFNSRIDLARSRLSLFSGDGRDLAIERLEGGAEGVLRGRARGLSPGGYRLHWQVLAIDGHLTRGDIPFRVVEP